MTVIQFVRKDKTLPHHRKPDSDISNDERMIRITEGLMSQWETHSRKNSLNDFVASVIPNIALGIEGADYVNNVSNIAHVEYKLDIRPIIFAPSSSVNNPDGWIVASTVDSTTIWTPQMPVEANARAFHVLLYVLFMYSSTTN
jgi:hypothetical protein